MQIYFFKRMKIPSHFGLLFANYCCYKVLKEADASLPRKEGKLLRPPGGPGFLRD